MLNIVLVEPEIPQNCGNIARTCALYKDFRAAHKRCNSIGMIIFGYFFNTIALVFYVINFVRMKSNKAMAERILTRQGVK